MDYAGIVGVLHVVKKYKYFVAQSSEMSPVCVTLRMASLILDLC